MMIIYGSILVSSPGVFLVSYETDFFIKTRTEIINDMNVYMGSFNSGAYSVYLELHIEYIWISYWCFGSLHFQYLYSTVSARVMTGINIWLLAQKSGCYNSDRLQRKYIFSGYEKCLFRLQNSRTSNWTIQPTNRLIFI